MTAFLCTHSDVPRTPYSPPHFKSPKTSQIEYRTIRQIAMVDFYISHFPTCVVNNTSATRPMSSFCFAVGIADGPYFSEIGWSVARSSSWHGVDKKVCRGCVCFGNGFSLSGKYPSPVVGDFPILYAICMYGWMCVCEQTGAIRRDFFSAGRCPRQVSTGAKSVVFHASHAI